MNNSSIKQFIEAGNLTIGIEFGSTRIKTVAVDDNCNTLATGTFEWENTYQDGYWTYSMNDAWTGLQKSYSEMTKVIKEQYGATVKKIKSLGISGMMCLFHFELGVITMLIRRLRF